MGNLSAGALSATQSLPSGLGALTGIRQQAEPHFLVAKRLASKMEPFQSVSLLSAESRADSFGLNKRSSACTSRQTAVAGLQRH